MWARVKRRTENALLKLPFKATFLFRPTFIQPLHGIRSRPRLYRAVHAVACPLYPVWRVVAPGLAMIGIRYENGSRNGRRSGSRERGAR